MRRVLAAIVGFCAIAGGALAVAPPASAAKDIPIGRPTVWIDNMNYRPPAPVGLSVGPATTTVQVLLPPEVDGLGIKNVTYSLGIALGYLDGVKTSGVFPVLPSMITLPWAPVPEFLQDVAVADAYESVRGELTLHLRENGSQSLYDRYERAFPMRSGIQLDLPIRWDPASTATTAVADLRTPGAGVALDYSYHANLNSPIAVRRGQTLTFVSDQPGFFSTGPWSTAWPGRLEARYGWKPFCGDYGLRGCGGGTQTKPIPVKVSADGTKATVTFPKGTPPPPKAHGPSEIVELKWIPKQQYLKPRPNQGYLERNPKVPGTYQVVREVALR